MTPRHYWTINEDTMKAAPLYVAPCLKCGSRNIKLTYREFPTTGIAGGECQTCGHTAEGEAPLDDTSQEARAEIWNSKNDKNRLISQAEQRIDSAQNEIHALLQ